jgi:hypothetical protein
MSLFALDRAQHPFHAQVRDAVGFQKLRISSVCVAPISSDLRGVSTPEARRDGGGQPIRCTPYLAAHHADDLAALSCRARSNRRPE